MPPHQCSQREPSSRPLACWRVTPRHLAKVAQAHNLSRLWSLAIRIFLSPHSVPWSAGPPKEEHDTPWPGVPWAGWTGALLGPSATS